MRRRISYFIISIIFIALWNINVNAQSLVVIPEAEKVVITVITDNLADIAKPDCKIAKRHMTLSFETCILHAEHGVAYHVETTVNSQSHSFMYDFGSDFQGVKKNIESLKLDLNKLEALALSHDHFDHEMALVELFRSKIIPQGLPFYIGEQFFVGTYTGKIGGNMINLSALTREDIEIAGAAKIIEIIKPTQIVPGAYLTGEVEQVTDYEKIPPSFLAKRGNQVVQEDFIGEQSIIMNVKGKGLVILTGCAHRGIVNIVKYAQKITGMDKVHAIIGGFHLTGAKPEVIQKTIADIKAIGPNFIVPMHCTGFEALIAFAQEMPDQFILNTVGTKYTLTE